MIFAATAVHICHALDTRIQLNHDSVGRSVSPCLKVWARVGTVPKWARQRGPCSRPEAVNDEGDLADSGLLSRPYMETNTKPLRRCAIYAALTIDS